MRSLYTWVMLALVIGTALSAAQTAVDPERLLSERLQFTSKEVGQAREGQPVVKVQVDGEELAAVGAIKLPGKKERLSDWIRNIAHFRGSAELGVAQIVPTPPTSAGFAGVTLDAQDLDALHACTAQKCDLRVPIDLLAQLQREGMAKANDLFRQMLLAETTAYIAQGNSEAVRALVPKAQTLTALSPDLVNFLDRYPAASLPASEQLFYWAATPTGSVSIISLHHLIVYKPHPNEIWIADKNIYASRYFDTGVLVIALYDAPGGTGFYAVAGSRAKSGFLGGVGGTVLRRQIQRSASDTVKVYLEWLRDSLSAGL